MLLSCCQLVPRILACASLLALLACSQGKVPSLPDSSSLGRPRGMRMARVITHDHSPYSFDACDKAGMSGGVPKADCLQDLKVAMCVNRVDFLFLSDHPDEMQNFEMESLLLYEKGDRLLWAEDGTPIANRLGSCESGFAPTLMAGFEGRVLALGMTKHLSSSIAERTALYGGETLQLRTSLEETSDAVVIIPHTESRSLEMIESLNPDAIEIYNIHANVDPKIRKKDLNMAPFSHLPQIFTYLVDPYRNLDADLSFMHFVEMSPIYFQKWNSLVFKKAIAGFGGTDSHENIFPQKAGDGERLDSHRRMTRFMSNHLVVPALDPANIKAALKKGRGWMVFEGLGTPVNMDFYARQAAQVAGVGDRLELQGGKAEITVKLPSLPSESLHGKEAPEIRVELKRVVDGGKDSLVAKSSGGDLVFTTTLPGAYRAELWIKPNHLKDALGDFSNLAENEYRWIVTNHLYLEP